MSKFESKRGRKPKISKQDIVLAAVEHADEFGLHDEIKSSQIWQMNK